MKNYRFHALVFALLCVCLLFSACGGSVKPTPAPEDTTPQTTAAQTTAAQTTEATTVPQTTAPQTTESSTACPHPPSEWVVVKEPTCTESGEKHRICPLCGHIDPTYPVPRGHNFLNGVCAVCGDTDPDYISPVYPPSEGEIISFRGSITAESITSEHTFTAPTYGRYVFELLEVHPDSSMHIAVSDANALIASNQTACELEGGKIYTVTITQDVGYSSYLLKIAPPSPTVDLTGKTSYQDSLEVRWQERFYTYTAEVSGLHRFDFSGFERAQLYAVLRNASDEAVAGDFIDNGSGIFAELTEGESYTLIVRLNYLTYQHKPVVDYTLQVIPPIPAPSEGEVLSFRDLITAQKKSNRYLFAAEIDGYYCFELSQFTPGASMRLSVYDSEGVRQMWKNVFDDPYGAIAYLTAGQTYTAEILYTDSESYYTLRIGAPKTEADLTGRELYTDRTELNSQQNFYRYTAEVSGIHRFDFFFEGGSVLNLSLLGSDGSLISSEFIEGGHGLTAELTAGESYRLIVIQHTSAADYTIRIGKPDPLRDITEGGNVSDDLGFYSECDLYTYTAARDGSHLIGLSGFEPLSEGMRIVLTLTDSQGNTLTEQTLTQSAPTVSVELAGGETYRIALTQLAEFSNYTLKIE